MTRRRPPADELAATSRHVVRIADFVPTRLNVLMRMHWAARNRRLKAEAAVIHVEFARVGVPKATGKRRVTQRITLARNDRKRDDDGAWKGLLDALVLGGYLIDDGPDHVERAPLQFDRGSLRATTIILEDL